MPEQQNSKEIFLRLNKIETSLARMEAQMEAMQKQADMRTEHIEQLQASLHQLQKDHMKLVGICLTLGWVIGVLTPILFTGLGR